MRFFAAVFMMILSLTSPTFSGCLDEVGSLPFCPASVVETVETAAFVGNGPRLSLIDISNPSNLSHIATMDLEGSPRDLSISGDRLFIACEGAGLREFSVANPGDPVEIGIFETPGELRDLALSGDYVYSTHSIVDISDPEEPFVVGRFEFDEQRWKIDADYRLGFTYVTTTEGLFAANKDPLEALKSTLAGQSPHETLDFQ